MWDRRKPSVTTPETYSYSVMCGQFFLPFPSVPGSLLAWFGTLVSNGRPEVGGEVCDRLEEM